MARKTNPKLSSSPPTKEVRDRISEYATAAEKGRSFNITSRGRIVAKLAPRKDLPNGQRVMESISTTEIKSGSRRLSLVPVHGPYEVTRNGKVVAILYSPATGPAHELRRLVADIEELKILDEAKARRLALRARADQAIVERIALLRRAGDDKAAQEIADAHHQLGVAI